MERINPHSLVALRDIAFRPAYVRANVARIVGVPAHLPGQFRNRRGKRLKRRRLLGGALRKRPCSARKAFRPGGNLFGGLVNPGNRPVERPGNVFQSLFDPRKLARIVKTEAEGEVSTRNFIKRGLEGANRAIG